MTKKDDTKRVGGFDPLSDNVSTKYERGEPVVPETEVPFDPLSENVGSIGRITKPAATWTDERGESKTPRGTGHDGR